MPDEIWKPIPGYEGLYEASDRGRIRSLRFRAAKADALRKAPLILKQGSGSYGEVILVKDRVKVPKLVHTLILTTFIGPRPPGMEGAHDDGHRRNNHLSNLSWKTHAANVADKKRHGTHQARELNGNAKLTDAIVEEIRASWVPRSPTHSQRALARRYGVTFGAISKVLRGVAWIYQTPTQGEVR